MGKLFVFTGSHTESVRRDDGRWVGGRGEGVCIFLMEEMGRITKLWSGGKLNPTYLALDKTGQWLYTVNEVEEYHGTPSAAVSAYRFYHQTGEIAFINTKLTGGGGACHLSISPDGNYLLAANYSGGSLCVFPLLADHSIGSPSCFFQHYGTGVHSTRQDAPHVHQVVTDKGGLFVLAPDLGTDEVAVYGTDWQKGHLIPTRRAGIRTIPGMGPRHCVFDNSGQYLYVLCELGNAVCVYAYDGQMGSARPVQTISTLPEDWIGDNTASCIKLHPNGRFLYVSNRGHDSIVCYRIEENGLLSLVSICPSGGRVPRDFDISPFGDTLIVGNQESDELVLFTLDIQSGVLSETHRQPCGCVTSVLIANIG